MTDDLAIDTYSHAHDDFLVLIAAGNDGENGFHTVGSPAVSKNCLSVGASETAHTELAARATCWVYTPVQRHVSSGPPVKKCLCHLPPGHRLRDELDRLRRVVLVARPDVRQPSQARPRRARLLHRLGQLGGLQRGRDVLAPSHGRHVDGDAGRRGHGRAAPPGIHTVTMPQRTNTREKTMTTRVATDQKEIIGLARLTTLRDNAREKRTMTRVATDIRRSR